MKLPLVVLFALLFLVVSVCGRPSTRTRARRFRKPVPTDSYRNKLVNAAKFGRQKDDSGSLSVDSGSDVDENNETETMGAVQRSALARRRHSGQIEDMLDHSGSRSEDIDEWLGMAIEECHLDTTMRQVTPADVMLVFNSVAQFTNDVVEELSPHNDVIATVEDSLRDKTLEELILSHGELFHQFVSLMESAGAKGLCPFVSLQILFDRITHLGAEGFVGSLCNEAYQMMPTFGDVLASNGGKPTDDWLYAFGAAMRNDMKCIIQDVANLNQQVLALKNEAEQAKPSLRDVQQGLATIMASTGILEDEIELFREAVEKVGHVLEDTGSQHSQAYPLDSVQYEILMNAVERFLHELRWFNF